MSSKTYRRYPASDALKKGCPTTIESSCVKIKIAQEYVELREKYKLLKTEYQKSKVKLEQMEQLKKDNDSKLIQLTKKNDTINKLHTTITQLNNEIKTLKDISVHRNEAHVLEGKLKKKDHIIKELEKQISETKINNLEHLKNTIHQQNEQIKYLKEGYGKFNVEDESLKEENKLLKEGLDRLKEEHGELIKKLDEYKKISTQLFDLG